MSTIKVNTIQTAAGTGSLTVPAETGTVVTTASPSLGRRNLIINGDHQVQQRGTSFSTSGSDRFTSDRWALNPIGASPCSASIQFDSTLQKNTLKVTKETSTGDIQIVNKIEGFKQFHNKQFTLSYYVRASTSRDLYIGSGFMSTSEFTTIETTTVPATTQWQKFTRTFSSTDMSSYTEDGSSWLRLEFRLSGSSGGTVAAGEWIEFTDVQIELGSVATPFEHRSYGEELALCERYYQVHGFNGYVTTLQAYNSSGTYGAVLRIDNMRTTPSVGATGLWRCGQPNSTWTPASGGTFSGLSVIGYNGTAVVISGGPTVGGMSGLTAGNASMLGGINGTITADAEL